MHFQQISDSWQMRSPWRSSWIWSWAVEVAAIYSPLAFGGEQCLMDYHPVTFAWGPILHPAVMVCQTKTKASQILSIITARLLSGKRTTPSHRQQPDSHSQTRNWSWSGRVSVLSERWTATVKRQIFVLEQSHGIITDTPTMRWLRSERRKQDFHQA